MAYENELKVAVAAVRAAADVCRKVQMNLVSAETMQKRDKSPVTVADFASQAVVCKALIEALPGARIVGEEDSAELREDSEAAETLRASIAQNAGLSVDAALAAIDQGNWSPDDSTEKPARYWTLDPIDGTKGFLRGEQYAVALALIEDGQVVLGVLGCPNLDQAGLMMAATRGGGAVQLPIDGLGVDGKPVHVSHKAELADARFCESVESGHSDQDTSAIIAKTLGITQEPYRIDSQCKYAAVARGDAEIYLRLPTRPGYREKIWDHAAGMIVVEEAGGTVTDALGQPLDFSIGKQLDNNRGIIATHGKSHDEVVAAVKPHINSDD
jgi:3'(2'), 5'-bisphosphate nucleotidase